MSQLYRQISEIRHAARWQASLAVYTAMVQTYWEIGRLIVEEKQQGLHWAEYGSSFIVDLSRKLYNEFGKGYTKANLKYFRHFTFPFQFVTHSVTNWKGITFYLSPEAELKAELAREKDMIEYGKN